MKIPPLLSFRNNKKRSKGHSSLSCIKLGFTLTLKIIKNTFDCFYNVW